MTGAAPHPPRSVVLDWPIGGVTGWGTFGLNLALQLALDGRASPALLQPPAADLHPLHRRILEPALAVQRELHQALAADPGAVIDTDFPVLRALGNRFGWGEWTGRLRSDRNVGLIFFEDTALDQAALERARQFDLIVAGSSWNARVLREHGLAQVVAIPQGIDPTLFHPAPRSGLLRDRFVIFSGGKLEYRKGQDLVVAAFRIFRRMHPEALLAAAWHNPWPRTMVGLETTGHVRGLPEVGQDGRAALLPWLVANGIPADAVLDLGPLPNHLMAPALREADVALFPNRCEGGTNLVAMEAMACGVPAVLAANTGQLDLLCEDRVYPLRRQGPLRGHCPLYQGYADWGESEVEEIVETLETVYRERDEARRRGRAAAGWMQQEWSWGRQAGRMAQEAVQLRGVKGEG